MALRDFSMVISRRGQLLKRSKENENNDKPTQRHFHGYYFCRVRWFEQVITVALELLSISS
jgi:hypothetical protein